MISFGEQKLLAISFVNLQFVRKSISDWCKVKREVNRDDFIFVAGRRRIYWAICGPITADPAGEILTCIPEKLKE